MVDLGSSSFQDGRVRRLRKLPFESMFAVAEDTPWICFRQPLVGKKSSDGRLSQFVLLSPQGYTLC
jgi:hypothetical protein